MVGIVIVKTAENDLLFIRPVVAVGIGHVGGVTAVVGIRAIGQAITGVSTLAVGSFITFVAIVLGSALTMKVQYYKMVYEEEASFASALAASAMDSTITLRSASGKPSSRTKPTERYSGLAPAMATSLTVPWTERLPMSPPGKNSGEMTCPSVLMTMQEMSTAVQYDLPIKIFILNNQYMGMVRQWQELFYDRCYACTQMEHTPDFVKMAEAFGAVGLRATKPDEVVPVIKKALEINKPVIMDFIVEKEEGVYPMVPAGADITEMLLV